MKTLIFLVLLLITASSITQAQVGTAWFNNYNRIDSVTDYGTQSALDAAGNLYVTGGSDGDIVLVKYNPAGALQWSRTHSGTASSGDAGVDIKIDAAGNIYIGAIIKNTGSQNDIGLLKYNSAGVQQWVRTITGTNPTGNDKLAKIALDAAGNIYLTGLVSDSGSSTSDPNAITVKYNPAGTEQWRARYESSPSNTYQDEGKSVTVDAAGNVYVAGLTFRTTSSSGDMVAIKYNSAGLQQWAKTAGGTNLDEANDIAVSDSGFVYVTGHIYTGSAQASNIVTIKYNAGGDEIWRKDYNNGPGSFDRGQFIMLDDSSNVYIGGNVGDYLLIKYNAGGEQKWVQKYNGPDNYTDYLTGMTMDAEGSFYLTGEVQDTSATDGFYYPHCGTVKINNAGAIQWSRVAQLYTNGFDVEVDAAGDIYVIGWTVGPTNSQDLMTIKYSPSVGVQTISNEVPGRFTLMQNYPNPFNPVTKIKFDIPAIGNGGDRSAKLSIYNSLGKEIAVIVNQNLQPGSYEYTWEASKQTSGVYFYTLQAGEFKETKKMLLVK